MLEKVPLKWPKAESRPPASDSRGRGDQARDRRDWAAAALAYGQHLRDKPDDGPIWVQQGHMFKEAGLLNSAAESYDRALKLLPTDADVHVQRAILHKFFGEFTDAIALFREAKHLGFKDVDFVENEIGFLVKTDNKNNINARLYGQSAPIHIYVSCVVGTPSSENSNELGNLLGSTNYSYSFMLKGFCLALEAMGLSFEVITSPEYIPDIRKRSSSKFNLHFAFQPPDMPRFLKGAYNVIVMAWEFERLRRPHEIQTNHAFADPVKMLRKANEVWMISEYGAEAIRRSGITAVHTVPTPLISDVVRQSRPRQPPVQQVFQLASRLEAIGWVPLAVLPGLQSSASQESQRRRTSLRALIVENFDDEEPIFFLSVLNIYDYRKQIKPILEAFVRLAKLRHNIFLLLKVSFVHRAIGDLNEFLSRHQIEDPSEMAPPLVSDRIWLTSDVLSREELNHLYDLSAFYVSTPHGEGQNLPLLEAMARGVVPVSVDHTAMRDYISSENAIVVRSTCKPFNARLRARYEMYDINTFYVSSGDAFTALQAACRLEASRYANLSHHALATVQTKFGLDPFRLAIETLIERATSQAHEREPSA